LNFSCFGCIFDQVISPDFIFSCQANDLAQQACVPTGVLRDGTVKTREIPDGNFIVQCKKMLQCSTTCTMYGLRMTTGSAGKRIGGKN
jgi:hypothetical protein